MTFFQWFTETGEDDELAQLLRDELWADPMIFFGRDVRSLKNPFSWTKCRSPRTRRTMKMMARWLKRQKTCK